MKVQTGQGTIPLITLVGIFSISALNALPRDLQGHHVRKRLFRHLRCRV